jgi:putative redox protein
MTTLRSTAVWTGGLGFTATEGGQSLQLDASPALGICPSGLLLTALVGCTGIDVVRTLGKMRVPIEGFEVSADGDLAETHPQRYTAARLCYTFTGPADLDSDRIRRAVYLSSEKYCGVLATLRAALPVDIRIEINGVACPLWA